MHKVDIHINSMQIHTVLYQSVPKCLVGYTNYSSTCTSAVDYVYMYIHQFIVCSTLGNRSPGLKRLSALLMVCASLFSYRLFSVSYN